MGARRLLHSLVALTLALVLGDDVAQAAERKPTGPVQPNIVAAATFSLFNPTIAPPGTNDWNCRPSPEHPNPVLLSNGTNANAYANWANLSQKLADAGFCVFAGNFGGAPGGVVQTVGPIAETARQLAAFGDRILRVTGAKKLDVVGYSQGGMSPRYWIKNLGGDKKIGRLIGLSPSNYGTESSKSLGTLRLISAVNDVLGVDCPACDEQEADSAFLADLNAGGDTIPDVEYTVIQTRYDDVVTPHTNAFLKPAPNVRNILVQDVCGQDLTDHVGIPYDPITQQLVLNALGPANAKKPICRFVPPVFSG
ncbi:lipase [Longimycelium tulufanense]|uniref:Lipase n=1 Tax=Longimycelium tulufanense TaxID=907463 RepID=A0A8J3FSI5_9PSEU|nr:alpha/beta fold hydrolase [Longimycelium tulufanense]GGM38840.1 lipase [Longimycelium tulufanense]